MFTAVQVLNIWGKLEDIKGDHDWMFKRSNKRVRISRYERKRC